MENVRGLSLDLSEEITSLGEVIKRMQDLEEKKEQAIISVRAINNKYDQIINDLLNEHNNVSEKRDSLLAIKRDILNKLNKIYWFMFWKVLERINLNQELDEISEQIKELERKLSGNIIAQWDVKPTFEQECITSLDGVEIYFLNVGKYYDDSNDEAIRERFDQDNKAVIEEYQNIINSIILKCIEYIKSKTTILPDYYAMYYKIDPQILLDQYGIIPNIFQSDILLRIESIIDNIANGKTALPSKEINDGIKAMSDDIMIKKKK